MFRPSCILAASLALLPPASLAQTGQPATGATAEDTWLPSLQTRTPQQGFDLAIVMARRAVRTTQPDVAVLKAGRPGYAADAGSLIDVSGVAAAWFATIAAANDYWRE
ncbi:hexameric tyrosine-coordinated heme protein [Paracoccus sp. MKU1]|uniref:hexameric tyrosine-coordinated heme protein n=1 Tax=Paracoccus sp. MKU1 TaxID=1745182 RepID=UPI0009E918CA|nr:hexameric tyrosine-coordinated heme protein [Paracoccus sp. MKU1]